MISPTRSLHFAQLSCSADRRIVVLRSAKYLAGFDQYSLIKDAYDIGPAFKSNLKPLTPFSTAPPIPPVSVVRLGTPKALASQNTMPKASCRLGTKRNDA